MACQRTRYLILRLKTEVCEFFVHHISKKRGSQAAAEAVIFIRNFPNLSVSEVTADTAMLAGSLRNKYYKPKVREISFIGCIHLATALASGAGTFVTGDRDFEGVEEMKIEIYR